MDKRFLYRVIVIFSIFNLAVAGDIESLDKAKQLSASTGKLVLLEFFSDDCEYCSQMAQDAINNDDVKRSLEDVIHYKILIKSDHGKELSKNYIAGIYFPAFFLLNSDGGILKRWTGYTTPQRFISTLRQAMTEKITVEQRIKRFETNPDFADAVYLAGYFTEIMDYLQGNYYYDQARFLGNQPPSAYVYEIFQNTANSAWRDSTPFEDVLSAADTVLFYNSKSAKTLIKVAQVMTRLGRKLETTDKISKYLQAAIEATEKPGGSYRKDNLLLKAEYALYVDNDDVEAVRLKKSTLPQGWEKKPDQFYPFTQWCLERKINLEEAEMFSRQAVEMASPGEFKGKVLNTLALICEARGKYRDAVQFMELAIKEDPENEYYPDRLADFKEKLGG